MTHPQPADIVQRAQSELLQLQNWYPDTQPEFWALAVAWEAARFAWYVLGGDLGTAAGKLVRAQEAIADYERMITTRRSTVSVQKRNIL